MLVDEPIEASTIEEIENTDEQIGASLVDDENEVEDNEIEAEASTLSDEETEILAFVRENNLSLSTLRQFDAFTNALRAKAVKMNTLMPGAERDFSAMNLGELQAFVADRVALGKNSKLLGHTSATTGDGADVAEEKLTPGELLKGGNN
jgi:hypothetical protein